MARYIDADNFRKTMIKRFGCIPCLTDYSEVSRYDIPLDDALNLAPTADVVPKREYDAVVSAVDNSTQEFLKLHDAYQEQKVEIEALRGAANSYKMHYENLVREIFEEIDKILVRSENPTALFYHCSEHSYNELKKKYKGEKK